MDKFNKRGLVALILFHQKCKAQNKKGYSYFSYWWDLVSASCKEAKDSELLKLSREKLISKAKKEKNKYAWNHSFHCSMMGSSVKKVD